MAYSYPYVEDYIEIIAGYRTPDGQNQHSIFQIFEPLLSLARYDVKVIENLANQSVAGIGYTDKQASLARDLVFKYEKQLAKHQITLTTLHNSVQYRLPLRNIDRSFKIWIDADHILMRFPYKIELIEQVRDIAKQSAGNIHWHKDSKVWQADLTEFNLNWTYAFASANNFEIDHTVTDLMNLLLEAEKTEYAIQLQANDSLQISNAEQSMIEYINQTIGGFDNDNLLQLVDYSPILGYTVDKIIQQVVIETYGPRFYSLCANRELKVDVTATSESKLIADIVHYARETQRFPIFVFEPNLSEQLSKQFARYFELNEIAALDQGEPLTDSTKLVYVSRVPKVHIPRIPLLITSAGMVYGGDKQVWLQTADKVVYFAKEVYNKNTKGKAICKLA